MDIDRLKKLRKEHKMTQKEVANIIGITTGGYCSYEIGRTTPPSDALSKLSELFGVSVDYLLGNSSKISELEVMDVKPSERIPILGAIKAGYNMYAEQNILGYKLTDSSKVKGKEVFWLKVSGDSMDKVGIFDGSLVLVAKENEVLNKKIAIVRINGDEATVKQIIINENGIILQSLSSNPTHIPVFISSQQFEDGYAEIIGEVIDVSFNPNDLIK